MENLLRLVENLPLQVLDEKKLNFFTSKVSIWDYFLMHESFYKLLNVKEK